MRWWETAYFAVRHRIVWALNAAGAAHDAVLRRGGLRATPPHLLTVCAVMKNEGRYLAEWLAFHRAAGVDHFLIYDNASTDDTAAVAAAFEAAFPGTVTLVPWPRRPAQRTAYEDSYRRLRRMSRWVAHIDADEYLFGVEEDLKAILRDFDGAGAVCAHWLIYGSSGHVAAPEGTCIEAFTRRAPASTKTNQQYKAIARASKIRGFWSAHRPWVAGRTVDEAGQDVDPGKPGRTAAIRHARLRINHYMVKSRAEWAIKLRRGNPYEDDNPARFREDSFFDQYDRNEEEDPAALRFLPQVKAALAALATSQAPGAARGS